MGASPLALDESSLLPVETPALAAKRGERSRLELSVAAARAPWSSSSLARWTADPHPQLAIDAYSTVHEIIAQEESLRADAWLRVNDFLDLSVLNPGAAATLAAGPWEVTGHARLLTALGSPLALRSPFEFGWDAGLQSALSITSSIFRSTGIGEHSAFRTSAGR